jgi:hypothetical protein
MINKKELELFANNAGPGSKAITDKTSRFYTEANQCSR